MTRFDGRERLVIWDFDGVLCDSLVECAAVAALAVHMLENPGVAPGDREIRELCSDAHIAAFYVKLAPLRPFIVRGQDYLWQYYHHEHLKPRIGGSMNAYQRAKDEIYSSEEDRRYDEAFYAARKKLASAFGAAYRNFFRPYQGALAALRFCVDNHRTYVCTNRDQDGVCVLLDDAGIALPRARIFSKDWNGCEPNQGRSKTEQALGVLTAEGGAGRPFVIVEDQVKTPAELTRDCPLMRIVYASYGYGLRNDWAEARLPSCTAVARADLLLPAIKEMLRV